MDDVMSEKKETGGNGVGKSGMFCSMDPFYVT